MSGPVNADNGAEITSPPSKTAGEQDHSDPWALAGEDADAPADTGKPAASDPDAGLGESDGTGYEGEV
jgi:hypothetical protein